jgi:hypothetical protein
MYLRWQSRKRRRAEFGRRYGQSDVHWAAVIVENTRVDGKPTQRHVAYLAGFTESAVAIPAQQRASILSHRNRIKAALSKKIGKPPTKKQREQLDRFDRLGNRISPDDRRRKREQTLANLATAFGKGKSTR